MTTAEPVAGIDEKLLAAVAQSRAATVLADADENILFLNDAAQDMWGYSQHDLYGKSCRQLLPLEQQGLSLARATADDAGSQAVLQRTCIRHRNGETLFIDFLCSRATHDGKRYYLMQAATPPEPAALREENRLLRLVMNHVTHAVCIIDEQRRLLQANQAFTDLFGYHLDEIRGEVVGELLTSAHTDPGTLERLRARNWLKGPYQEEILLQDRNGRELWVSCSLNPAIEEDGEISYAVVLLEEVTERRQIRELERDVLRALTSDTSFEDLGAYLAQRVKEIAPDITPSLLVVDQDGALRSWAVGHLPEAYNTMVEGLTTGEGVDSCGTVVARGKPVISEDIATDPLWANFRDKALGFGLRSCWSFPIVRRDGSVAGTFAFYTGQPSRPSAFHQHIIDVSTHLCALAIEREESRREISRLVQFDQLTGLPNRNHLSRYVDEQIRDNAKQTMAVFSIGLDRFKDVNDALGHAAGDGVLVRIASRLLSYLHEGEFLGRTEGDLFVVIARNCNVEQASQLAERLRAAVAVPLNVGLSLSQLSLSASIGISMYPTGGLHFDDLLVNAKKAMYQVKASGGGARLFYDHAQQFEARTRLFLGAELKNVIAEGRLHLQYQPQVMAGEGVLYGVEALARWTDPVLGSIPSSKFIQLAEEIGEIENLGRWALGEACRQMAAWRNEGLRIPVVSVNLSPQSFRDRSLPDYLASLLKKYGLTGADLTIEITESAVMSLTPAKLEVVHALRAMGVGLSVDDFGTGFSSLSNLVTLPVTEVKIDRSFIDGCLKEEQLFSLVTAVIEMGQALHLAVVAEGVETEEQKALLIGKQCPVMQGYLFSRPMLPEGMSEWLAGHYPENAVEC